MTKTLALINARIYTDWHSAPAQALLIEDGVIKLTGSNKTVLDHCKPKTLKRDLAKMTVLPGFCDAHLHLEQLGFQLSAINCEGLNKTEILKVVQARTLETPAGEWIVGYGFNQNDWLPPKYGTAQELDAVAPRNPVLLHAKSLHAAWANSAAMRLAGIYDDSPDPKDGVFLRDDSGKPNGILLEYAISLVTNCIPEASPKQATEALLKTQKHLHSLGITSAHDFDDLSLAKSLLALNSEDKLRLRVMKNMRFDSLDIVIEENYRDKLNTGEFLRAGWIKLFADGALGPQSAAMLEPYENTNNRGILLLSAEQIRRVGEKARQADWSLSIHAIGDLALRASLDAIQAIQSVGAQPRLPHRIEHVQILDPHDLPRFNQQNVIASVQPIHATSDYEVATKLWGNRCKYAYAYKSLMDSGAEILFGTDAPVESASPFRNLHAAVTRQNRKGEPGPDGWYPEQGFSIQPALEAMTVNPARYFGIEAQTGKLTPGSNADFIIVKDDPFRLAPSELHQIKPEMTFVAGEMVYASE